MAEVDSTDIAIVRSVMVQHGIWKTGGYPEVVQSIGIV